MSLHGQCFNSFFFLFLRFRDNFAQSVTYPFSVEDTYVKYFAMNQTRAASDVVYERKFQNSHQAVIVCQFYRTKL